MKTLLIDTHNMCMRNLFAIPYDPTDCSWVGYRTAVLKSIRKLARDFSPEKIIFCQESHDRNWRHDFYEDYKANRIAARANNPLYDFDKFFTANDEFWCNMEKFCKNCQFIRLPHLEADDIIALTVMTHPDDDFTLISTDKDFYQLHKYENFKQYDPIKNEYINIINPQMALLEKIVRGDNGDNVPPLKKGVGPKTFQKIFDKGLDEWIDENSLRENFERNTKLISFDSIPHEYHKIVKDKVDNFKPENFDGRLFYSYIMSSGLGTGLDFADSFIEIMKRIKN